MSRLTGSDAYGLMEAYNNVYTSQELTEEQVWEEVETWVNSLIEEGYDLSDYTWDEMAEIYIDEASAPGVGPYIKQNLKPLPPAKPLSGEKGDGSGYGDDTKFTQDTDAKSFRPGVNVPKVKQFGRISPVIPHGIGNNANKQRSANSRIRRLDPGAPTSQKLPPTEKKPPSREVIRRNPQEESYDVYDLVISHLLDEGYANSVEAAKAIMVNMSEEWRDGILQQLDEISDGKVRAVRNKLKSNTQRHFGPDKQKHSNREFQFNKRITARNERTGSNVSPTDVEFRNR
jgi:hypothetical protein